MDTCKAIFFGLALIALAIFATDVLHPAQAGANQVGRYNISPHMKGKYSWGVWIIDTSTGRYRSCGEKESTCTAWLNL
jgi:hypothetical protein